MKSQNLPDSFKNAFYGIWHTLRSERNMKIHFAFMIMVIIAGLILRISRTEWMICILLFGAVIGAELLNTAIEAVVDLVSPEYHKLAKTAKDASSGAVLVLAIAAAVIGLMIFIPKII